MLNSKIKDKVHQISASLQNYKGKETLHEIFDDLKKSNVKMKYDLHIEAMASIVLLVIGFSLVFICPDISKNASLVGSIGASVGFILGLAVSAKKAELKNLNRFTHEVEFFKDFKMERLNPEREFYNIHKIFGNLSRSLDRNVFMKSYLSHKFEVALHRYHYGSVKNRKYQEKEAYMAVVPVHTGDLELNLLGLPSHYLDIREAMMDNKRFPDHTCTTNNEDSLQALLNSSLPSMIMASEKVLGDINVQISKGFLLVEWRGKTPFLKERKHDFSDLDNFREEIMNNDSIVALDFSLTMVNELKKEIEKALIKR